MPVDTLAGLLRSRARDRRPGLYFEERVWSWRAYVDECRERAAWLDAAHAARDAEERATPGPLHFAVLFDNVPELLFLLGGAALSGHVLVALNTTRSPAELEGDARATHAALVLHEPAYADLAGHVAGRLGVRAVSTDLRVPFATATTAGDAPSNGEREAAPEDLVMLIFTSGTSGRPRAVRVTQRKIAVPGTSLGAGLTPEDVVYSSMPLFHSGAIMAAYAPAVASGAGLVLRRRFSASGTLPDVRRYGCTYLHYVGKALSYVLATPERPDDADNPLRLAFGNEGSATAVRRFGRRFGCHVVDAFGSTETAIAISPDPAGPPGCLGRLPEGVEIRDRATGRRCPPAVVEDGRLLNADEAIGELVNTRGLGLFDGYYNDAAADGERVREGEFWSGDMAYADPAGFVFFAGRGTERLRVDGENLAVAPIEGVIREFPGVVEAAVYPVPDAAAGDQVMAALVLDGDFDPGAFAAFLAGRADLGGKSLPRYVRVAGELPQTPSHKVVKRVLAAEGWRAGDPVWWRPPEAPSAFRQITKADLAAIEDEFVRHGRHHLLER
ncbi:AMP-binding protein [Sphaerisporangium corydalis]|uniref:AMP-binding protein n=1 Tax=Sphaerisporangium corydalis TaxID=1441875 RepID=A0ABV9EI35_9ACTN|nr:AMP-binding protein [Sphaerisporangium corydalis]